MQHIAIIVYTYVVRDNKHIDVMRVILFAFANLLSFIL